MSFKNLSKLFVSLFSIIVLIPCVFIPTFYNNSFTLSDSVNHSSYNISNSNLCWPVPGYTIISSKFGYRKSPTQGASTFHKGIDIAAPSGSNMVAVCNSIVTFTGFSGAGGYTIILNNNNFEFIYHHASENFIVNVGDYVTAGSIIGQVGPKNVYGVPNNPYKDSLGKPTNGASTGPHLHFTIKKDGVAVNPLDYFII